MTTSTLILLFGLLLLGLFMGSAIGWARAVRRTAMALPLTSDTPLFKQTLSPPPPGVIVHTGLPDHDAEIEELRIQLEERDLEISILKQDYHLDMGILQKEIYALQVRVKELAAAQEAPEHLLEQTEAEEKTPAQKPQAHSNQAAPSDSDGLISLQPRTEKAIMILKGRRRNKPTHKEIVNRAPVITDSEDEKREKALLSAGSMPSDIPRYQPISDLIIPGSSHPNRP